MIYFLLRPLGEIFQGQKNHWLLVSGIFLTWLEEPKPNQSLHAFVQILSAVGQEPSSYSLRHLRPGTSRAWGPGTGRWTDWLGKYFDHSGCGNHSDVKWRHPPKKRGLVRASSKMSFREVIVFVIHPGSFTVGYTEFFHFFTFNRRCISIRSRNFLCGISKVPKNQLYSLWHQPLPLLESPNSWARLSTPSRRSWRKMARSLLPTVLGWAGSHLTRNQLLS